MEQKNSPKWKKLLGSGAFVVVCIVVAVALLAGALLVTLKVDGDAGADPGSRPRVFGG